MILIKNHIKETLKLSIPVSIAQLSHIMMGVVDSLMVGRLGAVPLAAASLVNGLFFLVLVLGIGMTLAITPLVAISKGAGKELECGIILRQGLFVNLVFSLLLFGITFFGAYLINYLNQPEEVAIRAISYLQILAYSVIPFLLFQIYRQFLEGVSVVRPSMIIAILANIFNAFFNWIFIFGKMGFQPLGLDGAGWSTFLTRTIMALTLVLYVLNSKRFKSYNPSLRFRSLNMRVIKKLISLGLPGGFQYFFEIAAFSFSAIMIGWIGAVQLAAHQIALNLASVTYMIILGISAAGTIRIGNAVGKRNITATRRAGFSAISIGSFTMFLFAIVFIILRHWLPTLYIADENVISLASSLLIIAAIFQIFDGIQAVSTGVLRGLKDAKIPLILTFAAYWFFGIPLGALLGFTFELGTVGIWIGLLMGLLAAAVLLSLRFNRLSKSYIHD